MLSTLRNAWKVADLRKRIIFTLIMVAIFRMGNFIPVPGVDTSKIASLSNQSGSLLGLYDLMSGGALSRFSIFAMGVVPYINASIIMQLLTIAIPPLEQLSKEGQEGRKKIQNYTRYSAIVIGAISSFGTYALVSRAGALKDDSRFTMFMIMLTLTTASVFLMWIGERITAKGIGNGVSLLIFINIISRFPDTIYKIVNLEKTQTVDIIQVVTFAAIAVALFVAVVIASLAERRIPVQYAGKAVGGKTFKGQSTHIPINVNASGVIAIIFAMSVMMFPTTIGQFWPESAINRFITGSYSPFRQGSWQYALMYLVLIVFFTWFYTQITFKPDEMAENMHKSSGFVPGIRPGDHTAKYIEKVLDRVSIIGGTFFALVAIAPILLETYSEFKGISFTGTGLLILVGVALENMRLLESQLVMRHYQGFLSE